MSCYDGMLGVASHQFKAAILSRRPLSACWTLMNKEPGCLEAPLQLNLMCKPFRQVWMLLPANVYRDTLPAASAQAGLLRPLDVSLLAQPLHSLHAHRHGVGSHLMSISSRSLSSTSCVDPLLVSGFPPAALGALPGVVAAVLWAAAALAPAGRPKWFCVASQDAERCIAS